MLFCLGCGGEDTSIRSLRERVGVCGVLLGAWLRESQVVVEATLKDALEGVLFLVREQRVGGEFDLLLSEGLEYPEVTKAFNRRRCGRGGGLGRLGGRWLRGGRLGGGGADWQRGEWVLFSEILEGGE